MHAITIRMVEAPRSASTILAAITVAEITGRCDRAQRGTTLYVLSAVERPFPFQGGISSAVGVLQGHVMRSAVETNTSSLCTDPAPAFSTTSSLSMYNRERSSEVVAK